ncbi:hypothetical protein ACFL4T_06070 [candidate division KSB1 bacterium]
MKRFGFVLVLSLVLIFAFCSKKSSDPGEEDIIKIEILVKENGSPVQNIYVIIDAQVEETVKQIDTGNINADTVTGYESTQTDQVLTNQYGKSNFSYKNKSLPDLGGIKITKVTIKRMNTVLIEDDELRILKSGASLNLEYEI